MWGSSSASSSASASASAKAAAATAHQQEQLLSAEKGINLLLNDDLVEAQRVLEAQRDSPFALAGLGICAFLTAAIGLEDDRLHQSMETLGAAERTAKKCKAIVAEPEPGQWWSSPGLEYEVLLADVVAAQSLVHILGESYYEYVKAMWKLNAAFKYFAGIYKAVFPKDIPADATPASIINDLNERYQAAALASSLKQAKISGSSSSSHSHSALGKLKSLAPRGLSSATDLSKLRTSSTNASKEHLAATAPTSKRGSVSGSPLHALTTATTSGVHGDTLPQALWVSNPVTSFIVSGGAFGHGIFELVFALMPPKGRKVFSWLGYGTGDRKKALKLLEVVAMTGVDLHASFASLALMVYYMGILLSSGWQADREKLVSACSNIVGRSLQKHESGTLWLSNKAKLARVNGQVDMAVEQLQSALTKPNVYRQAKSTLQFELCWVLLSQGKFPDAAASFVRMADLNSWSHPTYFALAASCLQEIPSAQRTSEQDADMRALYAKVPSSFLRKRFMGQPPSSELYLEKRMKFYRAKSERWVGDGRLDAGAEWFESVRITIALELSLFWNQYQHYPKPALRERISRLETQLEESLAAHRDGAADEDLDTPEEVALSHAILGACHISLPDFALARTHLTKAEALTTGLDEAYSYLAALSRLYQAILSCQEGEADASRRSDKEFWRGKLAHAEKKLDEMFVLPAYDMNGRVESRGQMLRVEINEKKQALGL